MCLVKTDVLISIRLTDIFGKYVNIEYTHVMCFYIWDFVFFLRVIQFILM